MPPKRTPAKAPAEAKNLKKPVAKKVAKAVPILNANNPDTGTAPPPGTRQSTRTKGDKLNPSRVSATSAATSSVPAAVAASAATGKKAKAGPKATPAPTKKGKGKAHAIATTAASDDKGDEGDPIRMDDGGDDESDDILFDEADEPQAGPGDSLSHIQEKTRVCRAVASANGCRQSTWSWQQILTNCVAFLICTSHFITLVCWPIKDC